MPSNYMHIEMDRYFRELRWIIYILTIQGGPVTKGRIQTYCVETFDLCPDICDYVIKRAEIEGIIKFDCSRNSYVLLPPPKKSPEVEHPIDGQELEDSMIAATGRMLQRTLFRPIYQFFGSCFRS